MTIDDTTLLAYVDGELPFDQRTTVERAIHGSDDMTSRVSTLRASQLPYAEAFSRQALPPVPESLRLSVDALIRRHLAGAAAEAAPDSAEAIGTQSGTNVHPLKPRKPRASLPWLAAAFAAGVFCCAVAIRLMPQLGGDDAATMTASTGSPVSPWIAAAAGYQQLYTRDTVASLQPDLRATSSTVAEIQQDDHLALQIPDLRGMGLSFKRVQRLSFHGKPLVQIVYLPQQGAPVALCVLKEAKADASPASDRVDGMDVVAWRRGQLGYALIGEHGGVDLDALGKHLYDGQVSTTIGRNDTHDDARSG